MKNTIVYHQVKPGVNCPDGIAAAWVVHKLYPDHEVVGWCYQSEELPQPEPGSSLIIVDFSFPGDVIEQWIRGGVIVQVIDHHKTAKEQLDRFYCESFQDALNASPGVNSDWNVTFDMNQCGATLAWKYFFNSKPMPVFLEYIRDRDLWDFELEGTQEIHEAMSKVGRTFDLFDRIEGMTRDELLACFKPIGEVLLLPKRRAVNAACARKEHGPVIPDCESIVYVNLKEDGSEDRLTSDICAQLYKEHPESPFVACYTSDGTWSLRSDKQGNNTDVGAIAKALGGGGHRNAAGFKP
jgi:oligoribonuclease NrnB/cAMP/cGMP phosphodiesterase (DHH superfamily)